MCVREGPGTGRGCAVAVGATAIVSHHSLLSRYDVRALYIPRCAFVGLERSLSLALLSPISRVELVLTNSLPLGQGHS